jgi:NRPS condensation-like uncharacterized protein
MRTMLENQNPKKYERKVTPLERLFTHSPYSIVTMVARIKGEISESMLRNAVSKVQGRHPNLRVRIVEDDDGDPRFTSEGAKEIPIETGPRESDDHWISLVQESCQIPFEFDTRPAIRLILVRSASTSELIILCHHILCDGLSLAYLARDLMVHLGDPDQEVETLPDPVPIGMGNIPEDVSVNTVVRFLINRMNKKWEAEKIVFDQEDYRNLNSAYWMNYQHQVLSVELSEAQTCVLVDRCRKEEVTVNSALSAAFVGAQTVIQGKKPFHSSIGVAASLRDRLQRPAGEVMGFYAGLVRPKYRYDSRRGFWDNARQFHQRVQPLLTNEILFQDPLMWCYLEPTILEAINFKKLGGLVPEDSSRYQKISAFSTRDDTVLAILKRDKMESLDRIIMGTAVTNLTRLDFPRKYGALELDRLMMKPGGAFPLINVNLVLGAVTCAGKLGLVIEFVEDNVDVRTMQEIKDRALDLLIDA